MSKKNGFSRRDFLKVVGATTGAAAIGCSKEPVEKIIPYLNQPDEVIPGIATWYSGFCGECSAGCGTIVRVREGRAVKLEGNPVHPVNSGGLCAHGQAALQAHYDPDRVRQPLLRATNGPFAVSSWSEALSAVADRIEKRDPSGEVVLLTNPLTGSALALVEDFVRKVPRASHVEFELLNRDLVDGAAEDCFGSSYRTDFDFSKAQTVVSFGADFLETWLSPVRFARDWAKKRRPEAVGGMSYVVHFEPRLSMTAANADRWVMNRPGTELSLILALLQLVYQKIGGKFLSTEERGLVEQLTKGIKPADVCKEADLAEDVLVATATALLRATPSLVITGGAATSGAQGRSIAIVANVLNRVLGNIGKTVLVQPSDKKYRASGPALRELIVRMNDKKTPIAVLIIAGVNPSYLLSERSGFQKAIANVPFVVSLSSQLDETTSLAHVVLPLSTNLESWSDGQPMRGVYSLNQPAMQPLYQTQSFGDSLLSLGAKLKITFDEAPSYYEYIRARWRTRIGDGDFERKWREFVERGGDFQYGAEGKGPAEASQNLPLLSSLTKQVRLAQPSKKESSLPYLLGFPSINSFDGKSANKPWMQELPSPITTSVWGSWVEMHPETALRYGISSGFVVQVQTESGALEAPVFLSNRIHRELIAIPIGQGHQSYGRYAAGVGANVLSVLSTNQEQGGIEFLTGVSGIKPAVWKEELVKLQGHDYQYERGILRQVSFKELQKNDHDGGSSELAANGHHGANGQGKGHGNGQSDDHSAAHHDPLALGPQKEPPQMYRQMDHPLYRWAMTVDLASCTGCSACVVACYAENNVPVVGKDICAQGREMSWIRMERFFDDSNTDQPVQGFMPMMCQQCGNAPCEPVCPVYATYHNEEGLNAMVYNRCVGTRYCLNNCSYKIRRFNWFGYDLPEPLTWQLNPDVTVRSSGVMEKCTFCIQRIREGRNKAKNLGRPVEDGEIQPACASSCPTKAITFGNLLDHKSKVYQDSQNERSYKVLDGHLNTQPAVTYLARVTVTQMDKG